MRFLSKSPKVFLMVQIVILAVSNAKSICLNHMRVIRFQGKVFQLIPIPGVIQTNRLDLIKNFSAHTTRALIRFRSIFITPHKPDAVAHKKANDFYHPCSINGQLTLSNEHSYQVQIGSKLIPEYPVNSLSDSYSQLKKTVGRAFKFILHGIVLVSISLDVT